MYSLGGLTIISIGYKLLTTINDKHKVELKKIENEKIYNYPNDTNKLIQFDIPKNFKVLNPSEKIIIKIPNQMIIKNIMEQKNYIYDKKIFTYDKNCIIAKINKTNEFFKEFRFDKELNYHRKIKFLFDDDMIIKYEKDIDVYKTQMIIFQNSILNGMFWRIPKFTCYGSYHCTHYTDNELKFKNEFESIYTCGHNDLYLLVKPDFNLNVNSSSSSSSKETVVYFDIVSLSNDKNKILNEKYYNPINSVVYSSQMLSAYFLITYGIKLFLY